MGGRFRNFRGLGTAALLVLCGMVDAFVLRTTWTGRQVTEGQFRHGYFERFGDAVGLALDNTIRPLFPQFLISDRDELGVPPGVVAAAPLAPGVEYDLACDSTLAPYVAFGVEAPFVPSAMDRHALPDEARLEGARTLALKPDGGLSLVAWDATLPWREDAARLSALHDACAMPGTALALTVRTTGSQLAVTLGRCSLSEPLSSPAGSTTLVAAIAGPDWVRIVRRPGWVAERWFVWPVLIAVVVRVMTTWWALGLAATVALSAVFGITALIMPVPATLTWPMALIIGIVATLVRATMELLRRLPRRARVPAALALVALLSFAIVRQVMQPRSFPPIMYMGDEHTEAGLCALVGYSTVQGASLRRGRGGIRWFLDEDCERCRDRTGALAAGGETLAWARDAYCSSAPAFGAGGQVTFYGGADDDFLWGVFSMARLFIVDRQGIEPWRRTQGPASAASLARIDAQIAALDGLMQCVRSRGARFLFLHDFLVTDLLAGREPDRATMQRRRRAAVEAAGGTFVDLYDLFGAEAGVAWFNDYVHPSAIAHERVADLACGQAP